MTYRLDPKVFTDEHCYFFSLLDPRFEYLNNLWALVLEKKFGKKFKAINVISYTHNNYFKKDNYIVLNYFCFKLQKKLNRQDVISSMYQEDLNKQFSKSSLVKKALKRLITKQGQVFILSFSDVWLEFDLEDVIILGPNPNIAERFDNKIEQFDLFKKLKLQIPLTRVFKDIKELRQAREHPPFFLSAAYSSGGFESKAIYTKEDLDQFYSHLRPVNVKGPFIASQLIEDVVLAPNISAMVIGDNDTRIICLSDQILRNNRYMGNLYPTQASKDHCGQMVKATQKIGDYLSSLGFKGLFGCDFLIDKKGGCYITDLNPRRQGGYLCNVLMSKKVDLVEIEAKLIFGDPIPNFSYPDFQVDISWGHSKLVPYFSNVKILGEFKSGLPSDPFNKIGAIYKGLFYPKGHTLTGGTAGYYIASSKSYDEVKMKLLKETEEIIFKNFGIYEGL